MNILLAEDDPSILVIAKLTLEKVGGHVVTTASDGEQALSLALVGGYDLILLDEMMPKKNGLMVAQTLKASGRPLPPIIFLSAKSQETDVSQFLEFARGYIPKPFDPMQLCQQIDNILTTAKGTAA